jgi:hypothetical protein
MSFAFPLCRLLRLDDIHHFHEKAKSSQDAVADFPYFFAGQLAIHRPNQRFRSLSS